MILRNTIITKSIKVGVNLFDISVHVLDGTPRLVAPPHAQNVHIELCCRG